MTTQPHPKLAELLDSCRPVPPDKPNILKTLLDIQSVRGYVPTNVILQIAQVLGVTDARVAVWLCMGARSVTDKVLAIPFLVSAFVACGFEHSVDNMYFLPIGVALAAGPSIPLSAVDAFSNLALVTIGNIFGGTFFVALVYWTVYVRRSTQITGTLSS
jgi:formate transporter